MIIGTATILVIAAIFYVAFTANSGLPWQRHYVVSLDMPTALRLGKNAQVKIAGVLVGQVSGVQAEPAAGGRPPYAHVTLSLQPSVGRLPRDTRAELSPASALGENYVALTLGHSRQTVPSGGTLPLQNAPQPVIPTDLASIFAGSAASSFREATAALGVGLAGRGTALNDTIGSLAATMGPLARVMGAIASPAAQFSKFLRSYEQTFAGLAPVSVGLADLVANGATTFGALATARGALGTTIELAPGAEVATAQAMHAVRPALSGLDQLAIALRPAGPLLQPAFTEFDQVLKAGQEPLRQLPAFGRALAPALKSLGKLSVDPNTSGSLRKLTGLLSPLNYFLELVTPAQEYCNVISLPVIGDGADFVGVGIGNTLAIGNITLTSSGATGENFQSATTAPNLNSNPVPIEDQQQCQAGNEVWNPNGHIGRPAGVTGRTVRVTHEPPGTRQLAQAAGLLTDPETGKLEPNASSVMVPAK